MYNEYGKQNDIQEIILAKTWNAGNIEILFAINVFLKLLVEFVFFFNLHLIYVKLVKPSIKEFKKIYIIQNQLHI